MRKLKYGVASSLDYFIAREDGSVDWLIMEGEHMTEFAEYNKTFDTVLMGRKTYEVALSHGMSAYPGMKNYVFSGTIKESPNEAVEIIDGDCAEFVRKLKNQDGKDIMLVGGGKLAAALLNENLLDEVVLNIHPVLLGSGIPVFSGIKNQVDLELTDSRIYQKSGLVLVFYTAKNAKL